MFAKAFSIQGIGAASKRSRVLKVTTDVMPLHTQRRE